MFKVGELRGLAGMEPICGFSLSAEARKPLTHMVKEEYSRSIAKYIVANKYIFIDIFERPARSLPPC